MATKPENARYEARMRVAGYVRGPRISAEAAERLRELAHRHRLTPSDVVTRLLLGIALDAPEPVGHERSVAVYLASVMREHRLSEPEARAFVEGQA